jgi:hypothetical protein
VEFLFQNFDSKSKPKGFYKLILGLVFIDKASVLLMRGVPQNRVITKNALVIRYFRQSLPKVKAFQLSAMIAESIRLQLRCCAGYVTQAILSLTRVTQ